MQAIKSSQSFGIMIRHYREKNKFSQTALAEKTGLRQATISDVENGSSRVRFDTVLRLLEALGCSMVLVPDSGSDDVAKWEEEW